MGLFRDSRAKISIFEVGEKGLIFVLKIGPTGTYIYIRILGSQHIQGLVTLVKKNRSFKKTYFLNLFKKWTLFDQVFPIPQPNWLPERGEWSIREAFFAFYKFHFFTKIAKNAVFQILKVRPISGPSDFNTGNQIGYLRREETRLCPGSVPVRGPFLKNGSFLFIFPVFAVLVTFAAVVVLFQKWYFTKLYFLPPPTRRRDTPIMGFVASVSGELGLSLAV